MTKYKLDDLLQAQPATIQLDEKKLDAMLEKALAQPQAPASNGRVLAFPRKIIAGGAMTGLLAAMLLITLNLPVNQQVLVNYTQPDSENVMLDDMTAADLLIMETLGV